MATTTRSTPEDGDLVIREDTRDGHHVYLLRTPPGADQYLLHSHGAAMAYAVAFAKRHGVRVWFTERECHFKLVEDFRFFR